LGCGCRTDAIIKGLKGGYITLEDVPSEVGMDDGDKV